jgi:glycosyltransferase involved in cell wall biosynthesis
MQKKPHIALFTSNLRGGGAQRMMVHIAQGFAVNGFKVDLVLLRASGALRSIVHKDIRIVDLNANTLTGIFALARYLRREQPDILLSTITGPNLIALRARDISGAPTKVIIRQENLFSRKPKIRGIVAEMLARKWYHRADAVVAISRYVARELTERISISPERVSVLYNPVIIRGPKRSGCPHPWLAQGQPPVIIGAGYFDRQKDFSTLMRAFALVRKNRQARLIILGEGPQRRMLERLAQDIGVAHDVLLPGFVPDAQRWFACASAFALSSEWEGFGNVLVEALACGTPVVSTDCGPAREILYNGNYGAIVPIGDEHALANALINALDNPPNISKLQKRAQEFSAGRRIPEYVGLVLRTLRNI